MRLPGGRQERSDRRRKGMIGAGRSWAQPALTMKADEGGDRALILRFPPSTARQAPGLRLHERAALDARKGAQARALLPLSSLQSSTVLYPVCLPHTGGVDFRAAASCLRPFTPRGLSSSFSRSSPGASAPRLFIQRSSHASSSLCTHFRSCAHRPDHFVRVLPGGAWSLWRVLQSRHLPHRRNSRLLQSLQPRQRGDIEDATVTVVNETTGGFVVLAWTEPTGNMERGSYGATSRHSTTRRAR